MKKNKAAQLLGRLSAQKRREKLTKEEFSEYMKKVRMGSKLTLDNNERS